MYLVSKQVQTKHGNWRLDAERLFLACHKWSYLGGLYLYANLGLVCGQSMFVR